MERLARDIDTISKNIRKKYRSLRYGISESEELLAKTYKPILDKLVVKKEEEEVPLLKMEKQQQQPNETPDVTPRFIDTEVVAETSPSPNVTLEELLATPDDRQRVQDYVETLFKGPLAREYFHMMMSDNRDRLMDHTYGVRNVDSKWKVGNAVLEVDEDDDSLYIAGKRYNGTRGLYELLFMQHPENYNENDLAAYKSILRYTNAHKHYYQPGARINTNRSNKYREVIARLFPPLHRTGRGIDYVHWNDPNELVDRLRLLISSQQAGHTGHENEIISIVEELREANIIR